MRYIIVLIFAGSFVTGAAQKGSTAADSLLLSLIGNWSGKGVSFKIPVEDQISFDTVLGSRFLFMKLSATKGDSFNAYGYLWYNTNMQRVEFYEFNDGAWPVRVLNGKTEGNKLTLEEHTGSRNIRLTFVVNRDSFELEEAMLKDGSTDVFVKETFIRLR